ncbi:unnamed protein product [Closterium sp. NIES-53]
MVQVYTRQMQVEERIERKDAAAVVVVTFEDSQKLEKGEVREGFAAAAAAAAAAAEDADAAGMVDELGKVIGTPVAGAHAGADADDRPGKVVEVAAAAAAAGNGTEHGKAA